VFYQQERWHANGVSSSFGKIGVLACLGKRASSLFLSCPSVLKCQTTESHMMMTASITEVDSASGRKVGFDPMANQVIGAMINASKGPQGRCNTPLNTKKYEKYNQTTHPADPHLRLLGRIVQQLQYHAWCRSRCRKNRRKHSEGNALMFFRRCAPWPSPMSAYGHTERPGAQTHRHCSPHKLPPKKSDVNADQQHNHSWPGFRLDSETSGWLCDAFTS